jgi:L-malate glycosyltransferase
MVRTKLNILFLSSWYPNRLLPKQGIFVQRLAEAMSLHFNVYALHVCSDASCKKKFEIEYKVIGSVHTVNVYYKKVSHKIAVLSHFQKASRYFKAHLTGYNYINKNFGEIDLTHHNNLYPAGIFAWYLKKIKHIPYIITENWTGYLSSKKQQRSSIEKILSAAIAGNAACITPVSGDLKKAMQTKGFKSRYEILYNVVDTSVFYPREKGSCGSRIKLIHFSSLDDSHKNISGMIRAAAELTKKRNDFEISFIGDLGSKRYIDLAKNLNVHEKTVFFDGIKDSPEVARLMRQADGFILFSNYENLPCVMIEAFASGIPVLASDVGGISEHLGPAFGMLTPAGDEKALLRAMDAFLDKIRRGEYSSSSLRQYAEDHFSYHRVSEKARRIYDSVLNRD